MHDLRHFYSRASWIDNDLWYIATALFAPNRLVYLQMKFSKPPIAIGAHKMWRLMQSVRSLGRAFRVFRVAQKVQRRPPLAAQWLFFIFLIWGLTSLPCTWLFSLWLYHRSCSRYANALCISSFPFGCAQLVCARGKIIISRFPAQKCENASRTIYI